MDLPKAHQFTVSIDGRVDGIVVVLWPCDGDLLRQYVMTRFALDSGDRNTWDGKCFCSPELDEKLKCPSAVIALKYWDLNLKNPTRWESNSRVLSVLAHECFHAAEWMLRRVEAGYPMLENGSWEPWEDAAYLLQRIMTRSLDGMLQFDSSRT